MSLSTGAVISRRDAKKAQGEPPPATQVARKEGLRKAYFTRRPQKCKTFILQYEAKEEHAKVIVGYNASNPANQ